MNAQGQLDNNEPAYARMYTSCESFVSACMEGEKKRVIVHGQAHKRNEEKKIKQRDDEKTGHLN